MIRTPNDPECPTVMLFVRMHGPGDSLIADDFKRKHRRECMRCHYYGLAHLAAHGVGEEA